MAEESSKSKIKEIHEELINSLIEGHVGYERNTRTYDRWNGGFRKHCDQPVQFDCSVRDNFDYLEDIDKISPGNYAVLKDIFNGDFQAKKKIDVAVEKIENIYRREKSDCENRPIQAADCSASCGINTEVVYIRKASQPRETQATAIQVADSSASYGINTDVKYKRSTCQQREVQSAGRMTLAKVVVPINEEQHDTGIKISVIFGNFIKDLKLPEYDRRRSPIEKGYEIVHGRGDWRSDLGRSVRTAQNRLVDNLRIVCSDNIANAVESIFKYWFDLLHVLENDYDLFVCRVGWERSIVIVLESGTSFARTPWTSEVESHIRDIFSTIGQRGVVNNVTVVTLSATEARRLYDKFDSVTIGNR